MNHLDTSLLERFFEGDLDEQELAAFDKKLQADAAFAAAFELEKDLHAGIETFGNQQLRAKLNVIHHEETGKPEAIVRPIRHWMWLAAAVLLGLVMLARVLFERPPTPQQLYAIYAVHDFDFTEKSGAASDLASAEKLLKEKRYPEALPLLESYLAQHPEDGRVALARGVALIETGKTAEALTVFEELQENPLLAAEANWYVALVFLKENRLDDCLSALGKVPGNSARHKDAQALKEVVGKLKK